MTVHADAVLDEIAGLTRELVAIDSVNPTLVEGGAGEAQIATFVARWLARAGLEVKVEVVAPGRPNVVAVSRGSGGGRTLLLLAHTDTVGTDAMAHPDEARIDGDRLYGRGAYDMKGGLAAAMAAVASVRGQSGDVIFAAVCDEEAGGIGTKALLASGLRADAAIVTEPTDLDIAIGHKGFAAFEIETTGVAAHGSRPDLGRDAILAMGAILSELKSLDDRLQGGRRHGLLGTGSLHASLIKGGQELSSYPQRCMVQGEWRTVPGDDPERDLSDAIDRSGAAAVLRIPFTGAALQTPPDAEIVRALQRQAPGSSLDALPFWADSALLCAAGIPTVLYGPSGGGAHAAQEWVDLDSVTRVRNVLIETARDFTDKSRP